MRVRACAVRVSVCACVCVRVSHLFLFFSPALINLPLPSLISLAPGVREGR